MTSFVHPDFRTEHPGVIRAEQAVSTFKRLTQGFTASRGAATLLLSAMVAALLVIANQVVDTWTEGHLLMAWIVMWTVVFAALALLAGPARNAGSMLRSVLRAYAENRQQLIADDKLMAVAMTDARVMADISRAMTRDALRDVRGYY